VRTDPKNQVLRTDAAIVIATHVSDIIVVDASEVSEPARWRADWIYRLEAVALTAGGRSLVLSTRAAPVCRPAASAHVLALVGLSLSTLEVSDDPADDGLRCCFRVENASGKIDR
jgi:hypothetical protein